MLQNLKLETTAYTVFVVAFFLSGSDTSHVITGFELGFDHWGTICPLG